MSPEAREINTTISCQCSAFLHDMSPVSSTHHTRRAPTSSIKWGYNLYTWPIVTGNTAHLVGHDF